MAKLNKTQKKIVLIAGALLLIAWHFPPYYEAEVNDKGELTGSHIKWEFNKDLRDAIKPDWYVNPETGWKSIAIWEYANVVWLWELEFFGILVLAAAALLVTKKAKRN